METNKNNESIDFLKWIRNNDYSYHKIAKKWINFNEDDFLTEEELFIKFNDYKPNKPKTN